MSYIDSWVQWIRKDNYTNIRFVSWRNYRHSDRSYHLDTSCERCIWDQSNQCSIDSRRARWSAGQEHMCLVHIVQLDTGFGSLRSYLWSLDSCCCCSTRSGIRRMAMDIGTCLSIHKLRCWSIGMLCLCSLRLPGLPLLLLAAQGCLLVDIENPNIFKKFRFYKYGCLSRKIKIWYTENDFRVIEKNQISKF